MNALYCEADREFADSQLSDRSIIRRSADEHIGAAVNSGISWPPVLRRQSFNLERLYPLIAQVLEQEQRIGMSVIGDLLEISAVSSYAGLVRNGVGRYSSPSEQSQGVSELAFWLSTFRQARKYLDRDVDHYREYQDSERVDEFLRTNECIIQLVNETRTRLQTKFPSANIYLEVLDDPDVEDRTTLGCFVRTTMRDCEAQAIYEEFREEWWLENKSRASGLFAVYLEYTHGV